MIDKPKAFSRPILFLTYFSLAVLAPRVMAETPNQHLADTEDMLSDAIAFKTVKGNGQISEFAEYLAEKLESAGFSKSDIDTIQVDDTAALTVRYSGRTDEKPILLLGHMDVVPVNLPEDWVTEDPFKLTEKDGFLYGRGTSDMKAGVVAVVQTLMRLKSEGFTPRRDMVLLLTGDEETTAASTQELVKKYHDNAAFVINIESGGGILDDQGQPIIFGVQTGEKEYGDYILTNTSPGGHSSQPNPPRNAIYRMSKALNRLSEYQFPVKHNETTSEWLSTISENSTGLTAAALKQFSSNPEDADAVAAISRLPAFVGQIGTTCVATKFRSGEAPNALPQQAEATVNCRIWPGVTGEEVKSTLEKVIDDPSIEITYGWEPQVTSFSPVDQELMELISEQIHKRYSDVSVTPVMSVGASDSAFFREAGLRAYGVNPIYSKPGSNNAHGVNERIRTSELSASLDFWYGFLPKLADKIGSAEQ